MAEISNTDKPVLVLLHGWGVNRGVWQTILADIVPTVQVIALDIPGFGQSQPLPTPGSFNTVVAELATRIPANSLVCGWSMGGLLAIALAEQYPQKVSQLALVAATPCFLQQTDWPGMKAVVMQQFAQSLQRDISQTVSRFLAIQAMGSATAKSDAAVLKHAIAAYPQASATALNAGLTFLSNEDLRQSFAGLNQPVVGCFGALDSLVPAGVVGELQKLQPAAKLSVLAKASHAPFISHRAEFLTWLNDWLITAGTPQ